MAYQYGTQRGFATILSWSKMLVRPVGVPQEQGMGRLQTRNPSDSGLFSERLAVSQDLDELVWLPYNMAREPEEI